MIKEFDKKSLENKIYTWNDFPPSHHQITYNYQGEREWLQWQSLAAGLPRPSNIALVEPDIMSSDVKQ